MQYGDGRITPKPEAEVHHLEGQWEARLYGPDGVLKQRVIAKNLITTTGKNMLAQYIESGNAGVAFARFLGIGTGTTTPAVTDTTLTSEVGTRVTAGSALTANTAYYSGIFTAGNPVANQTIAEYGNFSLGSVGFIYSHATAGAIVKTTVDTLEVDYQFTFT